MAAADVCLGDDRPISYWGINLGAGAMNDDYDPEDIADLGFACAWAYHTFLIALACLLLAIIIAGFLATQDLMISVPVGRIAVGSVVGGWTLTMLRGDRT